MATQREAAGMRCSGALPGLSEVVIESTDASIEELKGALDERAWTTGAASTRPTSHVARANAARGLAAPTPEAAASAAIDR